MKEHAAYLIKRFIRHACIGAGGGMLLTAYRYNKPLVGNVGDVLELMFLGALAGMVLLPIITSIWLVIRWAWRG